jgi:hypothetical protein
MTPAGGWYKLGRTDSKALPKIEPLPGVICEQRVRCGKPGCRCNSGSPHRAFYRFWRERGKLKKKYIRKGDLEYVRACVAAWGRMEAAAKTMLKSSGGRAVRRQIKHMIESALGEYARLNRRRGAARR